MAPSSIRKALGLLKDQATISLAKMASHDDPEIEILIVKSTTHEKEVPNINHSNEILRRISSSKEKVKSCVSLITKRIQRTHDWIVELKCLILVHRLIIDGGKNFVKEIAYANSSSRMLSNLCFFEDLAHSNSWEYTDFVRRYGMYLVKKVELMVFDEMWLTKREVSSFDDLKERKMEATHLRDELILERVLSRMERLQRLLQRVLDISTSCVKKDRKIVILGLTLVVDESFELYSEISEGLLFLLDRFWGMGYLNSVKTFGTFATVAHQFDDLAEFYAWCKGVEGANMPVEYPNVEEIRDDLLRSMEESVKKKSKEAKICKRLELRDSVLASQKNPEKNHVGVELVSFCDVHEDSAVEIDKTLASDSNFEFSDTQWVEFWDNDEPPPVTSASDTPAAKTNNPSNLYWEINLVESEPDFPKQNPDFGVNFDASYDQSGVKQLMTDGSSSSRGLEKENLVLALPSIERSGQTLNPDPFSASLAVPPPSYVQLAELEKKHHLMVQEQQLWQEYVANGLQGQVSRLVQNEPSISADVPRELMLYPW